MSVLNVSPEEAWEVLPAQGKVALFVLPVNFPEHLRREIITALTGLGWQMVVTVPKTVEHFRHLQVGVLPRLQLFHDGQMIADLTGVVDIWLSPKY